MLDRVVDLGNPASQTALGVIGAPGCFVDKSMCRAIARDARNLDTTVQALLVPSIAFLDDATKWNLVVYLDRVPAKDAFANVRFVSTLAYKQTLSSRLTDLWRRFRGSRRP